MVVKTGYGFSKNSKNTGPDQILKQYFVKQLGTDVSIYI